MTADRTCIALFALAAALAWTPLAGAQQFEIVWWTIDGGGDMWTTGGFFELSGTIGQPDANAIVMTGGVFELRGGFWAGAAAPICRGDCNCDRFVNFDDINAFVAVLSGGTPCSFENCDVNGDGVINFSDINPFVALLSAGGGPCP
ncbi:MAG: hypothetical protein AB1716_03500 [Planctomycetota bacterium]